MPKLFLATASVIVFCLSPCVYAGDEVDYSAPYLVVENGELVTKYPAKEHEAGDADSAGDPDIESVADDGGEPKKTWIIVAVALAIVIAFLVHARRRSKGDSDGGGL